MDLRKAQYFFAVMEHRNLSNAAHSLRVSQPTLSRQMQALEEEFDTPLFVRHGRGMEPTEAGKRLHEGLRGLERGLRALKGDIAAASIEPTGEVAFGIPPSPRTLIAVPLIQRFVKKHPRVTVRVSEETSGELRDLVASGALDVAITNVHEPMRDVSAEPLAREQMVLVGSPAAKLSMKSEVQLERLADVPLVLTTRPNSLRLTVEAGLSRYGKRPQIKVEANALPLMTDLVQAGLGYTVLPLCGVRDLLRSKAVSASPISDFYITWIMAKTKSRPLSLAVERFCDLLQDMAREKIAERVWAAPR
jgi:LysR family nitrogen assimilation transcriptional regulator